MHPSIVFDVNETLLDLAEVRRWFGSTFGDETAASAWFDELLRLSFVSSITDRYVPFTELAAVALEVVPDDTANRTAVTEIKGILTTLQAHSDVAGGLAILVDAGFTVSALTNSPLDTAKTQLTNAHIIDLFDEVMSVDMVQRFKPHRSVYEAAARHLSVRTSGMVMVAAHDWDIAGAMSAGCDAVFITRGDRPYSSAFPEPTLIASDITDAAQQIIEKYSA